MENRKTLIVYYSYTGTTKKIAEELAAELDADIEEIIEVGNRSAGIFGFLKNCIDAKRCRASSIEPVQFDAREYSHIIVATPVWVHAIPPAIRGYVESYRHCIKDKASFLLTFGGSGDTKALMTLHQLVQLPEYISIRAKDVKNENYSERLKEFAQRIKTFFPATNNNGSED